MAVDILLNLSDVKGESKIIDHIDDIDVLNWNWGMSQSGTMHAGGGGGSGKVNVNDLSITKYVDNSTTDIMMACTKGTHFDTATLTVNKAGDKPLPYLVIRMKKVLVSSYSADGASGGDMLMENVSLNFAQVEVDYTPQDDKGAGTAANTMTWDCEANSE